MNEKDPGLSRVEALCHAARARPPAERDAFLEDACHGDEGLPREVKSLLACEDETRRFIEEPAAAAAAPAAAATPATSWVGRRLASCDVLAPLGAGGMGEVYRAKDSKLGQPPADPGACAWAMNPKKGRRRSLICHVAC